MKTTRRLTEPRNAPRPLQGAWTMAVILPVAVALAMLLTACGPSPENAGGTGAGSEPSAEDRFAELMYRGKTYYDKGEPVRAVEVFQDAVKLFPTAADAHLNLAMALLRSGRPGEVAAPVGEVLAQNADSAPAHYVLGCALLRLNQSAEALKALQIAYDLDPSVPAAAFQLGKAHQALAQWEDAAAAFQEATDLEPDHPTAHYALSQALVRLDRLPQAEQALARHRELGEGDPPVSPPTLESLEQCAHTQVRVPFKLEQPEFPGIEVQFVDATESAFRSSAEGFSGPLAVLDVNRRGANDLVVRAGAAFQILRWVDGGFEPNPGQMPVRDGGEYRDVLIGDLQHDHYEDVLVLGEDASHVFKLGTNGTAMDVTAFSGLNELRAREGVLVDLDFTGKLDLISLRPDGAVQTHRNLGNGLFQVHTPDSGVPTDLSGFSHLAVDDANNDDLLDLFLSRPESVPMLLLKQRGGPLAGTNSPPDWTAGPILAVGDLNNDLRNDLAVAGADGLRVHFSGTQSSVSVPGSTGEFTIQSLRVVDYDNDGWLDLVGIGDGVRLWRNRGRDGFVDVTRATGLDTVRGPIDDFAAADFDWDGDPDLVFSLAGGGMRFLRNDGGDGNRQLKLRLFGNRSNASGLGVRLELTADTWRTSRTVSQLPVEIGVGSRDKIDSITVRWFDLAVDTVDVGVDLGTVLTLQELVLPTGSCPYLYAWDGAGHRFVTDLLGASPLGLPVADGKLIEADPDEVVWIGSDADFKPRDGRYVLQITEELREVLYLDLAELIVVDRPPGVEVHPNSKLRPSGPFPPPQLVPVRDARPPIVAHTLEGRDVTAELARVDHRMVSPDALRPPQYRGLAEPHGVILDFGPLDADRVPVLVLNGWLRFGGGMANIAASHHPDYPFPFPQLSAETAGGTWQTLDVVAGAPAGKTKNLIIDLSGKLPDGTRRLRLTTAFEIHWDRVALAERAGPDLGLDSRSSSSSRSSSNPLSMSESESELESGVGSVRVTRLRPSASDLHWRGFSEFADLPWSRPLTPQYDRVRQDPPWRYTPEGWCTRYGAVDVLLAERDDRLVVMNGGDELTLEFDAAALPPRRDGTVREYFLRTSGWDKDADFHVREGWRVEPLPFHGQDDSRYGLQPGPPAPAGNDWIKKFNTRWVGARTIRRPAPAADAGTGGLDGGRGPGRRVVF